MKKTFALIAFSILFYSVILNVMCNAKIPAIHSVEPVKEVIECYTDERNLTCVMFACGVDTMGYDYLTRDEFDNFFPVHTCSFAKCPYKGVQSEPGSWDRAIRTYTNVEPEGDEYILDLLHFQYPNDSYDQLEDKLFKY